MHGGEAAMVLGQLVGYLAGAGYPDLGRAREALDMARFEFTDGERHRRELRELPRVPMTPEAQAAWDVLIDQHPSLATSLASQVPVNVVTWLFILAQRVRP